MNDYTLYLVKRAYYKKQLIKQAGNPINKTRAKVHKMMTDPAYSIRGINKVQDKFNVPAEYRTQVASRALENIADDYDPNLKFPTVGPGWGNSPQSATMPAMLDVLKGNNVPGFENFKLKNPEEYGLSQGALGFRGMKLDNLINELPAKQRPASNYRYYNK